MINHQQIRNDDPGGTLAEALVTLKAMTVEKRITLNSSQLNKWAAVNKVRRSVTEAAQDVNHPAYDAANAALFALTDTSNDLDLEDAETQLLLDVLVLAEAITPSAHADLIARSTLTVLKYPSITQGDLEKARAQA